MTRFGPLILSVYGNGIDVMCTLLSTRPHSGSVNMSRFGGAPPVAESLPLSPEIKTVQKTTVFFKK